MSNSFTRRNPFPRKSAAALIIAIAAAAYLSSEFRAPLLGYSKELTSEYQPSSTHAVSAVSFSAIIPGALVCSDTIALHDMLYDYEQYRLLQRFQPRNGNGRTQSTFVATPLLPRPSAHECAIVAPGSPMEQSTDGVQPQVIVRMPNGTVIHGYTDPRMIR